MKLSVNQVIFEINRGEGEPGCPVCNKAISNQEINVTSFWETVLIPINDPISNFIGVTPTMSASAYFHSNCLEQVAIPNKDNFLWTIKPEYVQIVLQMAKGSI